MFATSTAKRKKSKFVKRAAAIRFLGGCTAEELNSYFSMAFPLFKDRIKEDAVTMVEEIVSSVNVESTVPPRRLKTLVGLLRILVVHTGGLLDSGSLSLLLRLVLAHAACAVGAIAQRHLVHSTYIKTLRAVRSEAIDIVIWFFDKYQSYNWTTNEIDAVFSVLVWPWVDKFSSDSAQSPTPLLKLFATWSQHPRYYNLLGYWKEVNGEKISPLSALMDLWLVKIDKSVDEIITDIVERLLTLVDSEESGSELQISHCPFPQKINFPTKDFNNLNLGSKLMLHHATSVMEKLKNKLSDGNQISGKELEILSRISEIIMLMERREEEEGGREDRDRGLSVALHSLLLPVLQKRASLPEHVTVGLLTSLKNLAVIIPSPGQHVRTLIPLLAQINGAVPRKLLVSLIISSHKRGGSSCDLNYEVMDDLNSFSEKWLEQPDFDRRLGCFKRINALMQSDEGVSFDLGLAIVHTCYYFMHTEKDLSLKDSSSQCLQKLCPYLAKRFRDSTPVMKNILMNQTILNRIHLALKSRQEEFVRNESIVLLGVMVRECPDSSPLLRDLVPFANKDDPELDFFENMQHLQQHRRLRAMMKFCEEIKNVERIPKAKTMTQFMLPIVSYYLCNEKYIGQPTAVDCAIQAVTAICRVLPWRQYVNVLKLYLDRMQKGSEFQKQLVRLNIGILDAFHFDISSAKQLQTGLDPPLDRSKDPASSDDADDSVAGAKSGEKEVEDDEDQGVELNDVEKADEAREGVERMETEEGSGGGASAVTVLPESSASVLTSVIQQQLVHKLNKALSQRSLQDASHKLTKKYSSEESDEKDMVKIPLAIAIVKLLQKLPSYFLDYNISRILTKVMSYLKSRVEDVRKVARRTVQEMAVCLGPRRLGTVVREMTPLLTRGFHVHVLAFTVHSVLVALKPHFSKGDIDSAITSIIAVCRMDLFGDCSEEKEVAKILGKVMEARSSKSYSSFNIMAQFATEKYLLDLIVPLKEELSQTLAAKKVDKVSECLRQIVLGLGENQFVSEESLMLFSYGTASESIPSLLPKQDPKLDPKTKEWQSRRPPDSFLIPAEPKKQKSVEARACIRTNAHLLVETGLRLLYVLLKRERLKRDLHLSHLDPLVKLLSDSLKSHHVKVSIAGIQCLCWLFKYDLPSLEHHIQDIVDSLFSILHKFASAGLSKGDNFQLVFVTFKAMGIVVKEVKHCTLSQDQMRVLLMYCEQDLEDQSKQATAFSLLKSVLAAGVRSPELPEIIRKVATISVTAHVDSVRLQARQVVLHYLMEYPLGKKINSLLSFYYQNLDYEEQAGRESVLEMLRSVVETFPLKKLEEESSVLFINLAARLVNDPLPECRKTVAGIISSLISKIDKGSRDKLFDITQVWLQQDKESTKRLAAQIVGLFISLEKESFGARLSGVLPLLVDQFLDNNNKPGMFVLLSRDRCDAVDETLPADTAVRIRDHLLFQVLQALGRIITHIPESLVNTDFVNHWTAIFGHAHALLCHPHEWVRLGAVQLVGLALSTVSPAEVAASLTSPPEGDLAPAVSSLFSLEPRTVLRSVSLDLLAQLTPDNGLNDKFILQIMKLLVYVAEVLKELKPRQTAPPDEEEGDEQREETLSLLWLVKKMRKIINGEIVHAPSSTSVRTMCFKWIAAIAVKLEAESVSSVAYHLVAPLARELALCEESEPLREVAREAAQYVRSKLGHDEYTRLFNLASNKMNVRKAQRKIERAQMAVIDPQRAAKRKLHRQEKKREFKKRKVHLIKTNKFVKKPKKEIVIT